MESKQMRSSSFLLIVLIFGFAIENSSAKFGSCFAKCALECVFQQQMNKIACAGMCVPKCLFGSNGVAGGVGVMSSKVINDETHFCTLKCASSKCTAAHTQGFENIKDCANSCLGGCIMSKEEST